MDLLYPDHIAALRKAKLISKNFKFKTLKEQIELNKSQQSNQNPQQHPPNPPQSTIDMRQKKKRDSSRIRWFCIGYSTIWGTPIHKRLETLRKKHRLNFFRNRMSYSKFTNLGEKLNGDCQGKIMKGILDINEMDRPCNCDKRLKKGNLCWWGGNCRQATVVYELLCKETKKSYIGKTQRYFKTRTMEHVHDVWKVIESGRAKFGENWYGSGGTTTR